VRHSPDAVDVSDVSSRRGGNSALGGMPACKASQPGVAAVRDAVGAGDTAHRGTHWCDRSAHPDITAAPPRGRTVKVARSAHLAQLAHAEAGASGGGALCGGALTLPLAGAGASACTRGHGHPFSSVWVHIPAASAA